MNASYPSGLTVPTVAHPNLPDNSMRCQTDLEPLSVNPSVWFGTIAYQRWSQPSPAIRP